MRVCVLNVILRIEQHLKRVREREEGMGETDRNEIVITLQTLDYVYMARFSYETGKS